jgi:hypothetical protein
LNLVKRSFPFLRGFPRHEDDPKGAEARDGRPLKNGKLLFTRFKRPSTKPRTFQTPAEPMSTSTQTRAMLSKHPVEEITDVF